MLNVSTHRGLRIGVRSFIITFGLLRCFRVEADAHGMNPFIRFLFERLMSTGCCPNKDKTSLTALSKIEVKNI
jgi:hypothetical protein